MSASPYIGKFGQFGSNKKELAESCSKICDSLGKKCDGYFIFLPFHVANVKGCYPFGASLQASDVPDSTWKWQTGQRVSKPDGTIHTGLPKMMDPREGGAYCFGRDTSGEDGGQDAVEVLLNGEVIDTQEGYGTVRVKAFQFKPHDVVSVREKGAVMCINGIDFGFDVGGATQHGDPCPQTCPQGWTKCEPKKPAPTTGPGSQFSASASLSTKHAATLSDKPPKATVTHDPNGNVKAQFSGQFATAVWSMAGAEGQKVYFEFTGVWRNNNYGCYAGMQRCAHAQLCIVFALQFARILCLRCSSPAGTPCSLPAPAVTLSSSSCEV